MICKETLLLYPDWNKYFVIHTADASDYQLGVVISQEVKPIAFFSRKLNKAQKNYTTTEKELLEIYTNGNVRIQRGAVNEHINIRRLEPHLNKYSTIWGASMTKVVSIVMTRYARALCTDVREWYAPIIIHVSLQDDM